MVLFFIHLGLVVNIHRFRRITRGAWISYYFWTTGSAFLFWVLLFLGDEHQPRKGFYSFEDSYYYVDIVIIFGILILIYYISLILSDTLKVINSFYISCLTKEFSQLLLYYWFTKIRLIEELGYEDRIGWYNNQLWWEDYGFFWRKPLRYQSIILIEFYCYFLIYSYIFMVFKFYSYDSYMMSLNNNFIFYRNTLPLYLDRIDFLDIIGYSGFFYFIFSYTPFLIGGILILSRFPAEEIVLIYYLDFNDYDQSDHAYWNIVEQLIYNLLGLGLKNSRGFFEFEGEYLEPYEISLSVVSWYDYNNDCSMEGGGHFFRGFYSEFFFQHLYKWINYQLISYVVEGRTYQVYDNSQLYIFEGYLVNSIWKELEKFNGYSTLELIENSLNLLSLTWLHGFRKLIYWSRILNLICMNIIIIDLINNDEIFGWLHSNWQTYKKLFEIKKSKNQKIKLNAVYKYLKLYSSKKVNSYIILGNKNNSLTLIFLERLMGTISYTFKRQFNIVYYLYIKGSVRNTFISIISFTNWFIHTWSWGQFGKRSISGRWEPRISLRVTRELSLNLFKALNWNLWILFYSRRLHSYNFLSRALKWILKKKGLKLYVIGFIVYLKIPFGYLRSRKYPRRKRRVVERLMKKRRRY